MSETHPSSLDDSRDSGISTEKESEEISVSRSCSKRVRLSKGSYKSLTSLTAKDSLESIQKIRRRSDSAGRRVPSRSSSGGEKRGGKKKFNPRKKFDKPHVSEANLRKACAEDELNDKLVTLVQPRSVQSTYGIPNIEGLPQCLQDEPTARDIAECFEKLRISEDEDKEDDEPTETKAQDFSSGDQRLPQEFEELEDMACGGYDASGKKRSIQWNREVDVIYYAGDGRGGKVVRRENEPLQEESEQQGRRKRFIQLALTKSVLSNVVSASQSARDPWLPKSKSPSSSNSKATPAFSKRLLRMCGGYLKKNLDTASEIRKK